MSACQACQQLLLTTDNRWLSAGVVAVDYLWAFPGCGTQSLVFRMLLGHLLGFHTTPVSVEERGEVGLRAPRRLSLTTISRSPGSARVISVSALPNMPARWKAALAVGVREHEYPV